MEISSKVIQDLLVLDQRFIQEVLEHQQKPEIAPLYQAAIKAEQARHWFAAEELYNQYEATVDPIRLKYGRQRTRSVYLPEAEGIILVYLEDDEEPVQPTIQ